MASRLWRFYRYRAVRPHIVEQIWGLSGKNVGKEIMNECKGDLITAGIGLAIAGGMTVNDMIKNRKNRGKKEVSFSEHIRG